MKLDCLELQSLRNNTKAKKPIQELTNDQFCTKTG